jgi:ABC-2 type transport system permease protein
MDTPTPPAVPKINRWLPYWAVLLSDVRQTQRSWVYRLWVLASVLSAVGYLLYHVGVYQKAGIVQLASTVISDMLQWIVLGSITLIVVLTASSISAERGTVADSVLSRGISRYQYFLAKWHARLATVIGTFVLLGLAALACSYFFLQEDLSVGGSAAALATVAALLMLVTTLGVTFSALADSTLMGITLLWLILYGVGFLLTLLPSRYPSPYRMLTNLPHVLRGQYNLHDMGQLAGWCATLSLLIALVGLACFNRRDV